MNVGYNLEKIPNLSKIHPRKGDLIIWKKSISEFQRRISFLPLDALAKLVYNCAL